MLWLLSGVSLAADPFALPATVTTLDNGLVVLLLEDHRTDTVALHVTFGVGSRDELDGERGCAHLFEHLMFEGSRNVPVNAFDEWLTAAGGDNNAYTSEDVTAYHMTFPSGALDLALFLESDRLAFLDAGLQDENVANQQKVVLQERAEGYAEPNGRDWDTLGRVAWPVSHPYHHPVIGTVADIESFAADKVRGFWGKHYVPRNAVLALVGNFESEAALATVKHWFSDVPDVGPAPTRTPGPLVGGITGVSALVEDDVEERTMFLAWETVAQGHADEPALDLLANVLSNGQGTRLDERLYYGSQLSSSVGTFTHNGDLAGQFLVYASSPSTPLPKLEKLVLKELSKIAATPPLPSEVDRARQAIRGWVLDDLERPESRAEQLVECWRRQGKADCLGDDWARYQAVQPADLSRVANAYLIGKAPITVSTVPRGQAATALPGAVAVELP